MTVSCTKSWNHFKSPLRVVVQFLLRSRDGTRRKCYKLARKWQQAEKQLARCEKVMEQQSREIRRLKTQVRRLEVEKLRTENQSRTYRLPEDPPIETHGYGARMVCLSVTLAKAVGLRPAGNVLKIFFDWLGVETKIPHFTAIRTWLQRLGVAAIEEPLEQADDWIWMADHSNQIGPEKALVVLGVRASQMPPPGTALKHEDMHVLTVKPGTHWKRDDMATVYTELAEQYSVPRAVLCDGAVELRESVECLKKQRPDTLVLPDFKHKAAIFFKAILSSDKRFTEFTSQVGRTRSVIQQTELAHLTPPCPKPKARFMNLKATLHWAATVLWLLEHPETPSRQWMTSERLEDKLGWLRSFSDDLAIWCECEEVMEKGVTFVNEQGLFHGAADGLRRAIGSELSHATSRQLADKLIEVVAVVEGQLEEGERLPMSTEILESSFGLYKQIERQHSKGGFTSLLASFGSLLKQYTPSSIREAFSRVSVKDMRQWVAMNLGNTLTSKRRATYHEYKSSKQCATKLLATT